MHPSRRFPRVHPLLVLLVATTAVLGATLVATTERSAAVDPCTAVSGTLTGSTCTVTYTTAGGKTRQFTVPDGVSTITVTATGGTGAGTSAYSLPVSGGKGNVIVATLAVSPSDLVDITLQDIAAPSACFDSSPTGPGGGAAKVASGANLLVAAGGGSAGCSINLVGAYSGGAGGDAAKTTDAAGASGAPGQYSDTQVFGGAGGTLASGGAGGTGLASGGTGGNLFGGGGGNTASTGGFGGSGANGGGGGGSGNFVNAGGGGGGGMSANTGFTITSETLTDTGVTASSVTISFTVPTVTTTTSAPTTTTTMGGDGARAYLSHTSATCASIFLAASPSDTLSRAAYSTRSGTISQIAPGVIYYWAEVTLTGSPATAVTQSTNPSWPSLLTQAAGSQLLTTSCATVKRAAVTTSGDTTTITGTARGTYYLAMKYRLGGLVGAPAPGGPVDYTFTSGLGARPVTLTLVKKR
ncbi:MAG: hypothetical protein ACKOA9_09070 [Actinomycetota bacterium]